MKSALRICTQLTFIFVIFLGVALPFASAYTDSQISSTDAGGHCGTDVNGGSGTAVADGATTDLNFYPTSQPAGFWANPSHFCFYEAETWTGLICTGGGTCGGDTYSTEKWFVYNSTYVAIKNGPAWIQAPGSNGNQLNFKANRSFYLTPPSATLTANPASIAPGQSSTLSWSSTNADSCTSSDFSTGSGSPSSGSASVSPSATKNYTVTCTGVGGTTTATATVSVTASGVTATLTADPASIVSGNASALTWNSTNADSCIGTNFSTGGLTSGTVSVSPTATTLYTVTCTGTGGSSSATATVTVSGSSNGSNTYVYPNTATQPNLTAGSVAPTVATAGVATIFSAPITNSGGVSTGAAFTDLFQSATDANGTGATDIGTYASAALASLTSNTASLSHTFSASGTYYLRACADKSSAADSGVITESYEGDNCGPWTAVLVNAPGSSSLSDLLTATPSTIAYGASSLLSWTSSKATSCAGTGTGFATGGATVGTQSVTPLSTTFYSLDCTDGLGNHAYSTQTVTVLAPALSITASPSLVAPGSTTNIVWAANGNVSSCTVSGPGLSSNAISGSSPVTIHSESTYTFTCTAGSLTPSASVTVKVAPNYKEF